MAFNYKRLFVSDNATLADPFGKLHGGLSYTNKCVKCNKRYESYEINSYGLCGDCEKAEKTEFMGQATLGLYDFFIKEPICSKCGSKYTPIAIAGADNGLCLDCDNILTDNARSFIKSYKSI